MKPDVRGCRNVLFISLATMLWGAMAWGASGGPSASGHDVALAVDGVVSTYWQGDASVTQWNIVHSYGYQRDFNIIKVDYLNSSYIPSQARLYISQDGTNWTEIGTFAATDPTQLTVGQGALYFRVSMTGVNGSSGFAPAIAEMWDIPPSGASGGTELSVSTGPERAFDGSTSTFFQGSYAYAVWEVIYDYGSAREYGKMRLDYYSTSFIPAGAELWVSADAMAWSKVGNFPATDPADLNVNGSYRYYRIKMAGLNATSGYTPAIREVTDSPPSGATGGPSLSDSTLPEYAFDTETDTFWQGAYSQTNWFLEYGYRVRTELIQVRINYYSNDFIPESAVLFISDDGFNWTEVDTFPQESPAVIWTSESTSYIRIEMNGLDVQTGYSPAITEVVTVAPGGWGGDPLTTTSTAAKAFDGNSSTFFQGTYDEDEDETWRLGYNYRDYYAWGQVTVNYYSSSFIPNQALVQISDDFTNWENIDYLPSTTTASVSICSVARFMRVVFTGLNPTSHYSVAVKEMTEVQGCTAGGPSATDLGPANAFDGSLDTYWQGSSGTSWYLLRDYAASTEIGMVTVNYYDSTTIPASATVQTSADGLTWITEGTLPQTNPADLEVWSPGRFLRVEFSGVNPSSGKAPAVRELSHHTGPYATGGPSYSTTSGPAKAFDGSSSTFWQGTYTADSWQITYDYLTTTAINIISVDYYDSRFIPVTATLRVSNNAVTWTTVDTFPATDPAQIEAFTTARYLQVQMTGKNASSGYTPAIREVLNASSGSSGGPSLGTSTPANAFDNNTSTFWQGDYAVNSWQVTYTYGTNTVFNSVTVDYYDSRFIPAAATLQVSSDGSNWTTVGTFPATDPAQISAYTNGTHLRVQMDGKNASSGYTPAIREITKTSTGPIGSPSLTPSTPANAFDNNTSTFWQGDYSANSWQLGYAYGASTSFGTVTLDYYDTRFMAVTAVLQVSNDGSNWTTVGTFPATDPTQLNASTTGSFLRVQMDGKNASSGYTPAIREMTNISPGASGGPSLGTSTPAGAFDGSTSTFWQGDYAVTSWQLIYNYGTSTSLRTITLDYYDSRFIPTTATLQVSTNGIAWSTVGTFPATDPAPLNANTSAPFMRIQMDGKNGTTSYTPAIREITNL